MYLYFIFLRLGSTNYYTEIFLGLFYNFFVSLPIFDKILYYFSNLYSFKLMYFFLYVLHDAYNIFCSVIIFEFCVSLVLHSEYLLLGLRGIK